MRVYFFALVLSLAASTAVAAAEVEMEACEYTPEVKKELKLTSSQEPKLEKVFSDLAPLRKRIDESMQQRDQMVKNGASREEVSIQTRKTIALEIACRQRGHELLRPILNNEQFDLVLEMEEVHRRRVTGQSPPAQAAPPAQ